MEKEKIKLRILNNKEEDYRFLENGIKKKKYI